MAVLISYPKQTKNSNKEFFERKEKELTNLDWAYWGGWFDTDGSLNLQRELKKKDKKPLERARLSLKDREPVELFSKVFETSLIYFSQTTITPEPYKRKYECQTYAAKITAKKAIWFARKIARYIKIKRDKIFLLTQGPFEVDDSPWTDEEFLHYAAGAYEGDGCFHMVETQNKTKENRFDLKIDLASSNIQHLSDFKNNLEERFLDTRVNIAEGRSYTLKDGTEKNRYVLNFWVSNNLDCDNPKIKFLRRLKDVMTMSRKKNKIIKLLNIIDQKREKQSA